MISNITVDHKHKCVDLEMEDEFGRRVIGSLSYDAFDEMVENIQREIKLKKWGNNNE